jgi:hypothetical protein
MTPFETAAGFRKAEGTDAQHLIDVGVCEIVSHLRRKEANPALGRGAGGWIVNFSENEYRALAHFPPRF